MTNAMLAPRGAAPKPTPPCTVGLPSLQAEDWDHEDEAADDDLDMEADEGEGGVEASPVRRWELFAGSRGLPAKVL